ncbi:twin-arginine translocase subunit TatC [Salinigranum sp. GCM10025319]|uniref:twin-arginine translocase subunit TatC n=1 Tax=Salinigranum sp. GCM10025319 TaxID=3252687 RepID=UPI00360FF5F5
MADDPEPRGSQSDDADAGADAPSESDVEQTPVSDSKPDSESDAEVERDSEPDAGSELDSGNDHGTGGGDGFMDGESDMDDAMDPGADGDVNGDADGDVNGDADDTNAATDDDAGDDADGTDRFEHAVGDRDEEGMPKPTPPIDSGDVDVDGTEAATSGFEFGALPDEAASEAETSGFQFGSARDEQVSDATDAAVDGDDPDVDTTAAGTAAGDTGGAALETPELDDRPTGDARDAPTTSSDVVGEDPAYDPTLASDDGGVFDGPDSDVEMPLADHIEEMVKRLGIVFLIAGVVAVVVFPIADDLVNFLWNTHIPGATTIESRRPRLYGPLELILTEFKVAGLAGFIVGLPVFVYQTYRFMRPGLYPKERKYYLAAVPTSLVLAFIGVAFAHFVVLPAIFAYFTSYTIGTAVIAFGLKETFGLILVLMGYMALVFQIPLFIMLAIMMNLVTRQWLSEKRLLFWGGFLGLSFLVSPDPTGMAPIIIAATMIVLFEGTLLLLKWVGR